METLKGLTNAQLAELAHKAGLQAGEEIIPTPMVVTNEDLSFVSVVEDGLCGFAWVNIKPARGSFVNYLKSMNVGSVNTYSGGYEIWVSQFGQSYTRKQAYAKAFAEVLRAYDIKAIYGSRLD
jgi:hypothetical protein